MSIYILFIIVPTGTIKKVLKKLLKFWLED